MRRCSRAMASAVRLTVSGFAPPLERPLIDPKLFDDVPLIEAGEERGRYMEQIGDESVRFTAQVKLYLKSKMVYHSRFSCDKCWMLRRHCMCVMPVEQVQSRHRLVVYMHPREYFRATNTGKVLKRAWPSTKILVCGIPEHESELAALIAGQGRRAMALFPDTNASTAAEIVAELGLKPAQQACELTGAGTDAAAVDGIAIAAEAVSTVGGAAVTAASVAGEGAVAAAAATAAPLTGDSSEEDADGVTLIALDGTWNQARALFKRLPPATRILRLAPPGESQFKLRRQTQHDRICTLEAVSLALRELLDVRAADALDRVLHTFNQAGRRQMPFMPEHGTKKRDPSFFHRRNSESGDSAIDDSRESGAAR